MAPIKSFLCSFESCDSVFTKASELKKHEFAHAHPEKIFRCTVCDFTTLQKKNLHIHMARHTGEKRFQCPHTVTCLDSPDPSSPSEPNPGETQCDFRTSDPAALTRHRKAHHGYIPTRRGRLPHGSGPPSLVGPTTTLPTDPPHVETVPRRSSFLVPTDLNGSSSDSSGPSPESPRSPTTLSWTGGVDAYQSETTDVAPSDGSGYRSECSDATLVAPEQCMPIDPYYALQGVTDGHYPGDSSYSGPIEISSPIQDFDSYLLLQATGREGCLCPEWMVEAGIEGWDESVLAAHRAYYAA